jgi:diphosphomevalonate decarboxylase
MDKITTLAHPNIALVKYWGKRDEQLNLPAVGSISVTLDELQTKTTIEKLIGKCQDEIIFNDVIADEKEAGKIRKYIDLFREKSNEKIYLKITTSNNFPTSAGLASSASGFAALAKGLSEIFELKLDAKELSRFARLGSSSAARSIFGGYVQLHKGILPSGKDCFAEQILAADDFPLKIIIAITDKTPKKVSSRKGMKESQQTSPYYNAWVESSDNDLLVMKKAIIEKDFFTIAEISIQSCLKMHSVMMTTQPPLIYWNSKTFAIIEQVLKMYNEKFPVFFTIDAGPQVKIFTVEGEEKKIIENLKNLNLIDEHFVIGIGKGIETIED